jgi:hypothetical protein
VRHQREDREQPGDGADEQQDLLAPARRSRVQRAMTRRHFSAFATQRTEGKSHRSIVAERHSPLSP